MSSRRFEILWFRAYFEFERVSDYIWKSPSLVEHERELELRKLRLYFGNNKELREDRWKREAVKLEQAFPHLIATGNLFNVISTLETYLLLLSGELEVDTGHRVREARGQGIRKLLGYLGSAGLAPQKIEFHEQIHSAIKVRNCLMHSSGMLDWSRESAELRKLHASKSYLSPQHRRMRRSQPKSFDEVLIVHSPLGDRLSISNGYSHIVCYYAMTYFQKLCLAARTRYEAPRHDA